MFYLLYELARAAPKANKCECIWHDERVGCVGGGRLYEYTAKESKPHQSSETPKMFSISKENGEETEAAHT